MAAGGPRWVRASAPVHRLPVSRAARSRTPPARGAYAARMRRILPRIAVPLLLAVAVAAVLHRMRQQAVQADGGILINDATMYDRVAGWLLGGFYSGVADDVAATAGPGARVLDVGTGPGHLVDRLVDRGLEVSGIDLDPAMIDRAAHRLSGRADLAVADVAALPYADGSFDAVVSTLSMHHWAEPAAGLAELARVLRPGGTALIYDLAGAHVPLHGHVHGPAHHVEGSALEVVSERRWRWPGPISLVRRVEARRAHPAG
jgi:SAM-dependent methyltransferase